MEAHFSPVAFAVIRDAVREHLAALPHVIDSFLEERILASHHYRILVAGETARFASIHGEDLITQFALDKPYAHYGQPIFGGLRRLERVQSAFVPTCDEFFLAHAIDEYRQLAKQAYFFTVSSARELPTANRFSLHRAEPSDVALVREESGEFFAPIERYVAAGEFFLTVRNGEVVGFGLLHRSALYGDVASIGMYTIERFRRTGVGSATVALLMAECYRRGLRPVAGCWYYNHASKRTLERTGMFAPTRLLKIDY
jgi:RimJ/RimL family protein N-acetyltransferase